MIYLTSQRQWQILCTIVCFCSWNKRTALGRQPSYGGLQLHIAICNTFYAPLLCKRGMMKRISSLRNGIPAAPPPPHGHECCWRCSSAHWRKIPSTPILLSSDVLGLLIFHVSLLCNRGMGREMLRGDVQGWQPCIHASSFSQ